MGGAVIDNPVAYCFSSTFTDGVGSSDSAAEVRLQAATIFQPVIYLGG
jgi:hypothetical protein